MIDKIIIDTSVWISFQKGLVPDAVKNFLVPKMAKLDVVITNVILHEILVGIGNKSLLDHAKKWFEIFPLVSIPPDEGDNLLEFGWKNTQLGLRGGYADTTIAYLSHKHELPILSFDKYFHLLAEKHVIRTINIK